MAGRRDKGSPLDDKDIVFVAKPVSAPKPKTESKATKKSGSKKKKSIIDKIKEVVDDLADDGKLNGSNKED